MKNVEKNTAATAVASNMYFKDGKFHLDIVEVPDIARNEAEMFRVRKEVNATGVNVKTLASELELFNSDGETIYAWNYEEKIWSEISDRDRELWERISESCGEAVAIEHIVEYEFDTDSDPDTWAQYNGYMDDYDGACYNYAIDTFTKGRNAIYVREESEDYVIVGIHVIFTGFGIRTNPNERFVNTYHGVYGSNDTMLRASEEITDNILDRLELPEPLYTSVYSKSCFKEFCTDILGDNFEVVYVEEEPEEPEEVEEIYLIERAPKDCDSVMSEINADELDCAIRGAYDRNAIKFVDGNKEDMYLVDDEGNFIEFRIPVYKVAKYELDNNKYIAIEVDNMFKLWLYEHNGFIGNQYGYWYVPMDATKAVFEEFRKLFG